MDFTLMAGYKTDRETQNKSERTIKVSERENIRNNFFKPHEK